MNEMGGGGAAGEAKEDKLDKGAFEIIPSPFPSPFPSLSLSRTSI